mmetsp:Transcript_35773/g.76402  ORF Transcript_35773/g.76402 Transcript_35773/m.76402 type:complete len:258 (-) Transcript_35773:802-1575(-)
MGSHLITELAPPSVPSFLVGKLGGQFPKVFDRSCSDQAANPHADARTKIVHGENLDFPFMCTLPPTRRRGSRLIDHGHDHAGVACHLFMWRVIISTVFVVRCRLGPPAAARVVDQRHHLLPLDQHARPECPRHEARVPLHVKVLAVRQDGVPPHLEDLPAHPPPDLRVQEVHKSLPRLVARAPRPVEAVAAAPLKLGIVRHDELLHEAEDVRYCVPRVRVQRGEREELHARAAVPEWVLVTDEVQFDREAELPPDSP